MGFIQTIRQHEANLRRLGQGLVWAMLAVPLLIGNGYFFPFIVPKYIAFRILVELLVLVYLLLLAAHPAKYRPRLSWAAWAVVAYGASAVISGALGIDFSYSFWGTFERMESIFTTLHYVALFLVLPLVLSRDEMVRALKVSVGISAVLCLYGLAQKAGANWTVEAGRDRISATIGNPAYVAAYLLFQMAFAAYLWTRETKLARQLIWAAAIALQLVTFVYTLTRGAMLGLLLAVPLGAALWLWANRRSADFSTPEQKARASKMRPWVAGLLAAVILVPGALIFARDTSFVKSTPMLQRFTDISPTAGTAKTRFYTWNSAWQGIKEKPILGWGPEQFPVPFNKYINPLHYKGPSSETWFDHAHNIVLDIWATQGALGVIIWLAFIICLLRLAFKLLANPEQRNLGIITFCLLAAYVVQNMFLFDVLVVWMMLAFTGVLLQAAQVHRAPGAAAQESEPKKLTWLPIAYAAGLLLWLLPVNVRTAGVSKAIIVAKQLDGNTDAPLDSFQWFEEKIFNKPLGTGKQEAARQVASSFLDKMQHGVFNDKAEVRTQAMKLTLPHIQDAWHSYPYDLQTPITLSKVIAINAEADGNTKGIRDAIAVLDEAQLKSPQRIEIMDEKALYEMAVGDIDRAIEDYKKIVELTQGVPYTRWSLGYAYLKAGRKDEARVEMEAALQDPDFHAQVYSQPNILRRLANLYADLENWSSLAETYRQFLSLEPGNATIWGGLALTYQKLGDYSNAIAAAQEAAKADPQFSQAANELIAELQRQQRSKR